VVALVKASEGVIHTKLRPVGTSSTQGIKDQPPAVEIFGTKLNKGTLNLPLHCVQDTSLDDHTLSACDASRILRTGVDLDIIIVKFTLVVRRVLEIRAIAIYLINPGNAPFLASIERISWVAAAELPLVPLPRAHLFLAQCTIFVCISLFHKDIPWRKREGLPVPVLGCIRFIQLSSANDFTGVSIILKLLPEGICIDLEAPHYGYRFNMSEQ